jgi:hypothetical protein
VTYLREVASSTRDESNRALGKSRWRATAEARFDLLTERDLHAAARANYVHIVWRQYRSGSVAASVRRTSTTIAMTAKHICCFLERSSLRRARTFGATARCPWYLLSAIPEKLVYPT